MPFMHKHIEKVETPQLLREYRNTILQIASLDYDLKLHIYLQHPAVIKEQIADEMQEFIDYASSLGQEIEKRGL